MASESFKYSKTKYRFVAHYKDGKWVDSGLSEDSEITLSESACVLQYCQAVFEGLKAYKTKDGKIVCFRPDLNADRLIDSATRMVMPIFPKDKFIEAIKMVVSANKDSVPAYGTGGSLYLRPFMIGTNPVLGVQSASEYEFRIFASPVGAYFGNAIKPLYLRISDLDRAAPRGTGGIKAGLNYAMSLYPLTQAHKLGFDENVYLDSASRTYLEETGGANIIFVTKDGKLVTPKSDSILPSITRRSLVYLAKEYLHMEVEERRIRLDEIDNFLECGLCGTAAVISPVGKINVYGRDVHFETGEDGYGKVLKSLKDELIKIQFKDIPGPNGWVVEIE